MHAFEVLSDAVRRRLLELLGVGEQSAGTLTDVVRAEFGISQPAVSQHLKVLREEGFASVRAEGTRRFYAADPAGIAAAEAALARLRAPMAQRLDALHTEIARGRRQAASITEERGPSAPAAAGQKRAASAATAQTHAAPAARRKDAS
ncbi:metalloregulator ArsR/SmtB family transcription factor [Microbacterium invictum]|uniref:DNA-binding transcriptional ArsR family regulator n=1 Tax=Microbacterium invictum TaxID=515415 RepID=A0AA40SPR8_9MICO|nr:metalloregulator ArsR/SmtB family transcription factor [Microbacterium invictum]MBB4140010.1 DNA-binding transcriptional ArsR family regulator [Microbacterium invictum]